MSNLIDSERAETVIETIKAEKAMSFNSHDIYDIVRVEGEEELARSTSALLWSGIAAGIMISFSVVATAIFKTFLPDGEGYHLIASMGYSLGFILVILGRMQLFTENTITTILPLTKEPTRDMFLAVGRLWGIVLGANVLGAFLIAAFYVFTPAIPASVHPAIESISSHAVDLPAHIAFFRGIPAGILVASIVWLLPQSRQFSLLVIFVLTWLIAAGEFTHVIAGSVEMAYLILTGHTSVPAAIFGFFLPVLAGNVIGGTAIFTMLVWGQVHDEVAQEEDAAA